MKKNKTSQFKLFLVALAISTGVASVNFALAEDPCPRFAPISLMPGNKIYSDAKGSIADPEKVKANEKALEDIKAFFDYIEQSVDGAPSWSRIKNLSATCAETNLEDWAKGKALLQQPTDGGGTVPRVFYTAGLNIVALKLKKSGIAVDPIVIGWLKELNGRVLKDYENWPGKTNVVDWAGAAAATFALLSPNPEMKRSQDHIWKQALGLIKADGRLEPELARGRRALTYHTFAFSALLVLREARRSLGYQDTANEASALKRLADFIGRSLHNPTPLAKLAKSSDQEIPGEWGFRVIRAFGGDGQLLSHDWDASLEPVKDYIAIEFGGDTRKTLEAIQAFKLK